jgi:hypothetical protein
MLTEGGEQVLRAAMSIGNDLAEFKRRVRSPVPDSSSLLAFCELIAQNPREELLQKFLEKEVGYLTGLYGTRDNMDLAVLFKPPVGTSYYADFAVLQSFQGGSTIHLIEIETSHEKLFTKNLTPARRYQTALGQLANWQDYCARHRDHLISDLVGRAQSASMLGEQNGMSTGIRFCDPKQLADIWNSFGGSEASITFNVVIGRWSTLSPAERHRIVSSNRFDQGSRTTFTYEQVLRQGNYRMDVEEF